MDSSRHRSWFGRLLAVVLGYASLISGLSYGVAPTLEFVYPLQSPTVHVGRDVVFKGTGSVYYRPAGTPSWIPFSLTPGGLVALPFSMNNNVGYFTGFVSTAKQFNTTTMNVPNVQQTDPVTKVFEFTRSTPAGSQGTFTVELPSVTVTHTRTSGSGPAHPQLKLDPAIVDFGDGSQPPEVEGQTKKYDKGWLLLDNRTGEDQPLKIGDEDLTLKPGYNSFPFYGEVDENGFPKAVPPGIQLSEGIGPDGTKYWSARLNEGIEGPPVWGPPPAPVTVLPPQNGTSGPTVKLPNGQTGISDYLSLPPGMSNANVPIPPGVTPGSNVSLPPGVTPGSFPGGSLPYGTVSGGTNYLPPNTSSGFPGGGYGNQGGGSSAGVIPTTPKTQLGGGNQGNTTPSTGGTGGTGGLGELNLGFYSSPGIDGFEGDAHNQASEVKDTINKATSKAKGLFGETGAKWWDAAGQISGDDNGWTHFNFTVADRTVEVEIPPEWLSLIRLITLWVIKFYFVMACIKLFMR